MAALDLDCSHAICIPACNEDHGFQRTLESLVQVAGAPQALIIIVVNGADDSSDDVHAGNQLFLEWIRGLLQLPSRPWALAHWEELNILLVDHASPGLRLPARQGVGLARKIASDIALMLYAEGKIRSPWMGCTDADVELPADYLTSLPSESEPFAAALYPFVHMLEGDASQQQAMRLYECFLHYFVLGMRWAGSPYAYHSIGSSFAVHMERYAAVRGFPRRLAAEDFYLLNKLIKQAPLVRLQSGSVRIRGRASDRVPFGTGRALQEIQAKETPYKVYDPRVFAGLGQWIRALSRFAEAPDTVDLAASLEHPTLPKGLLLSALTEQGAIEAAHGAREQARPGKQLRRRLFEWNDAFRSLRLIHLLRDRGLESMELRQALDCAPFIGGELETAPADEAWAALSKEVARGGRETLGLF
jgi:hypothetical protein